MNFLGNFLKLIQVKEETTTNMDNILESNGCASENDNNINVSKSYEINSIISDDNSSIYDLHLSTENLECIEGSSYLNSTNSDELNMIDFEELIDISHEKTTAESLTEFKNVITSYQIPGINNSLDEVNEYLGINTERNPNDISIYKEYEENALENKMDILKYSNTYKITNLNENKCITTKNLFDIENDYACYISNNKFEDSITIDTKKDILLKEFSIDAKFSKETETNQPSNSLIPKNEVIHDSNIHNSVENTLNIDNKEDLLFNDLNDKISLKEYKEEYLNKDLISTKCEIQDLDDNDDYNSSDFEFIDENEAKIDLLGINYNGELKTVYISPTNSVTIKSESKTSSERCIHYNDKGKSVNMPPTNSITTDSGSKKSDDRYSRQRNIYDRVIDPGEGSLGLNRHINNSARDYRKHHIIPEGEDYFNLFRGQYNPVLPLSEIIYLENKSTRPLPMNAQYEGIGFDLRLMRQRNEPDRFEAQYAEEAKESIKRITLEYPVENRKKRRFRN